MVIETAGIPFGSQTLSPSLNTAVASVYSPFSSLKPEFGPNSAPAGLQSCVIAAALAPFEDLPFKYM